jgi:hypothetical protein
MTYGDCLEAMTNLYGPGDMTRAFVSGLVLALLVGAAIAMSLPPRRR